MKKVRHTALEQPLRFGSWQMKVMPLAESDNLHHFIPFKVSVEQLWGQKPNPSSFLKQTPYSSHFAPWNASLNSIVFPKKNIRHPPKNLIVKWSPLLRWVDRLCYRLCCRRHGRSGAWPWYWNLCLQSSPVIATGSRDEGEAVQRSVYRRPIYRCFQKQRYPKMDDLQWKTLLKWMIWGYPYFWKHPYQKTTLTYPWNIPKRTSVTVAVGGSEIPSYFYFEVYRVCSFRGLLEFSYIEYRIHRTTKG